MLYKRLVPVLLLKDGLLVRSQLFRYHQAIGDPIPTIKRLSDWSVDEIVLLNIGSSSQLDSRRDDKWHNIGTTDFSGLVSSVSSFCFAPLTVGGGIRTDDDFSLLFSSGADKCVVNTALFDNPDLVRRAVSRYGSQAIVASLDLRSTPGEIPSIYTSAGQANTSLTLSQAITHVLDLGVGEIILSSIDRDGSALGYDPVILSSIPGDISVPVIINSGPGSVDHFSEALCSNHVQAVAASNIFYFTELSYPLIKRKLIKRGHNLRPFDPSSSFIHREPAYDPSRRESLMAKSAPGSFFEPSKYDGRLKRAVRYCTRCLYPSLSASPMQFDEHGVCMGCRTSDAKFALSSIDYAQRRSQLSALIASQPSDSGYDCIVSVSGGKDSYYQTHYVIHELGLKPLLVTYNGNNYTDVGWRNLLRMRHVFECDHIIVSPSVSLLRRLNRFAFVVMGDMNWHAHVGIFTTAPRIAIQQNIPFIFWGEHGYADLCGQFSMQDYPEMNYRERTEHAARGFDWPFFVGLDGITSADMTPWKYPSDQQLLEVGLRQIYLGHYIPWESNDHLALVVDRYQFEVSDEPFDRTYRRGSNLDDMHENGVHDYLKFIKFGYGRCTDHASKDIRAGKMSRKEGIELVNQMDPIKPRDLARWLDYVGMDEKEFDRIADHFRDPRVWTWSESQGWSRELLSSF